MKRVISTLLAYVMLLALTACGGSSTGSRPVTAVPIPTSDTFKIGIVTGTVSQSGDDRRGAEGHSRRCMARTALSWPPIPTTSPMVETTIQKIAGLAVIPTSRPSSSTRMSPEPQRRSVRSERRPDILCIAGGSSEDLPEISSAADLVCNNDFVARGYLIIHTAHELGCTDFVHISFPRHMAYETMSRRAMRSCQKACEGFKIAFHQETAPDPTSDVGIAGAQPIFWRRCPSGSRPTVKAAYFCTNDAHQAPAEAAVPVRLLHRADLPSP